MHLRESFLKLRAAISPASDDGVKAPVITKAMLRAAKQDDTVKIVNFACSVGLRFDSLVHLEPSDLSVVRSGPDMSGPVCVRLHVVKDKIRNMRGRSIILPAACFIAKKHFPLEHAGLSKMLHEIKATWHSPRRTLAVLFRIMLGDGSVYDPRNKNTYLLVWSAPLQTAINVHFGWSVMSKQFLSYSSDFRKFKLPDFNTLVVNAAPQLLVDIASPVFKNKLIIAPK